MAVLVAEATAAGAMEEEAMPATAGAVEMAAAMPAAEEAEVAEADVLGTEREPLEGTVAGEAMAWGAVEQVMAAPVGASRATATAVEVGTVAVPAEVAAGVEAEVVATVAAWVGKLGVGSSARGLLPADTWELGDETVATEGMEGKAALLGGGWDIRSRRSERSRRSGN
jgi:hypothetical protein